MSPGRVVVAALVAAAIVPVAAAQPRRIVSTTPSITETLYALGLGEIHLNSALNQPFDADIELVSATQEDLGALRATQSWTSSPTK